MFGSKSLISNLLSISLLSAVSWFSPLPAMAGGYEQGLSLYKAHRYKEALVQFESAIRNSTDPSNAMYLAGVCYHQLGDRKQSTQMFLNVATNFDTTPAGELARKALASRGISISSVDSSGSPSTTRSAQRTTTTNAARSAPKSGDEIPDQESVTFRRERGGHLMVDVQINGRTQQMLFDTGAELTTIGKNQLHALGVAIPANLKPFGNAIGVAGAVPISLMPVTLQLGRIKRKINITVAEKSEHIPLLGQDFFGDLHYDIDNADGRINFTKPGSKVSRYVPNDTIDIPFRHSGKELLVTAKINGSPVELYFDTGAQGTILQAGSVKIRGDGWRSLGAVPVVGVGGGRLAEHYEVNTVELGAIRRTNMSIAIMPMPVQYGLLGQDFFGHRKYVIDYDKNMIRFFR